MNSNNIIKSNNILLNKAKTIKQLPENERPREILLNKGASFLTNEELLAILLDTGIRGQSVLELAKNLIEYANGIDNLSKMDVFSIQNVKGIGVSKAAKIVASFELSRRCSMIRSEKDKLSIKEPYDLVKIFSSQFDCENVEIFKVILLDTKNQIIHSKDISRGIVNASIVSPREVYKEAILRHSSKIMIMHNHPSGNSSPSSDDIHLTQELSRAGKLLDIALLDHIIYGSLKDYYSFKADGKL